MITVKTKPYNSIWVKADSQTELGNTFIRFQEYYESPNPEFRNKIFTLGQVRHWYSVRYGGDSYHNDWVGFNFPSRVLNPFRQGLFDPLTNEEKNLLDILKYRHDNFYIIGAQDDSVLRHELAHALYDYNLNYSKAIDQIIAQHKKELKKVIKYILDKGYDISVVNDEIQAYVTDSDDKYILEHTPKHILDKIIRIYSKYTKEKSDEKQ